MKGLDTELQTYRHLGKETYAHSVWNLFSSFKNPPTHYAAYEPIKNEWTVKEDSSFCNLWMTQSRLPFGQVLLRRRSKPSYYASVQFIRGPKATFNSISLYGMSQHFHRNKDYLNSLLVLIDDLFVSLDMAYGRVCIEDDFQDKNIILYYRHEDGTVEPRKPVGINWEYHLPGIYWCNYFGMPYVKFFGKEKLLSTPCIEAKVLTPDCIRILAYDEPTAFRDKDAKAAEYVIGKHIDSNAFFDKSLTNRSFVAPELDFSDLR